MIRIQKKNDLIFDFDYVLIKLLFYSYKLSVE